MLKEERAALGERSGASDSRSKRSSGIRGMIAPWLGLGRNFDVRPNLQLGQVWHQSSSSSWEPRKQCRWIDRWVNPSSCRMERVSLAAVVDVLFFLLCCCCQLLSEYLFLLGKPSRRGGSESMVSLQGSNLASASSSSSMKRICL